MFSHLIESQMSGRFPVPGDEPLIISLPFDTSMLAARFQTKAPKAPKGGRKRSVPLFFAWKTHENDPVL